MQRPVALFGDQLLPPFPEQLLERDVGRISPLERRVEFAAEGFQPRLIHRRAVQGGGGKRQVEFAAEFPNRLRRTGLRHAEIAAVADQRRTVVAAGADFRGERGNRGGGSIGNLQLQQVINTAPAVREVDSGVAMRKPVRQNTGAVEPLPEEIAPGHFATHTAPEEVGAVAGLPENLRKLGVMPPAVGDPAGVRLDAEFLLEPRLAEFRLEE